MPTSLTPATWVKCWSANSPNPPQPLTPSRRRPSSLDAELAGVGAIDDSLCRVRLTEEAPNRRPVCQGTGLDLQDARTPNPGDASLVSIPSAINDSRTDAELTGIQEDVGAVAEGCRA